MGTEIVLRHTLLVLDLGLPLSMVSRLHLQSDGLAVRIDEDLHTATRRRKDKVEVDPFWML
jgi:hypothetical protein